VRIIIKPVGAIVLLLAIGVLSFLVLFRGKSGGSNPVADKAGKAAASAVKSSSGGVGPTPAGSAIIDPDGMRWTLVTQPPANATMTDVVPAEKPGGNTHAIKLNVTAVDAAKYWSAQLIKRVPQEVPANRSMEIRFWARSATSTSVYVVFEEGQSPHAADVSQVVKFTPEWKEYTIPFLTKKDHSQVHANFCFKAGIAPGETEFSNVHVRDLGATN
jgi:hypothetical protein